MILGILALIAANAATILGARALQERVSTGKPAMDFVVFLLIRALLISAAVIVAGLLHVLTPLALGLTGAAATAALLAGGVHRRFPKGLSSPWNTTLVVLAGALLIKLLIQTWFFAPYAGDVLTYHLPKIAEWVREGGFTREMGLNARVTLPAGFEVLETWWVVFTHHDGLIELAGVEMLFLACAAVVAMARELGAAPNAAFGAALLFGLTPGLQLEATSTLNDTAVAAMVLVSAALILSRSDPLLLLAAAGLGAGIKPTYVYAVPGLLVLAILFRKEPLSRIPNRPAALLVAGSALAIGAAWYLRNLLWFGNPVYPMGTELGRQVQQFGPSLQSLRENLAVLVDLRVYDHHPAGALHTGNANWGALAFACGFPALIVVMRDDTRLRKLSLAFGISVLSVLTLVTLDAWNMRFILFVPALPAIALARLAAAQRPVLAALVPAALLCFLGSLVPSELSREQRRELTHQDFPGRTSRPSSPEAMAGEPVACAGEDFANGYWFYGPTYSRRVVYIRDRKLADILAQMNREGSKVIYVSPKADSDSPAFREGVEARQWDPFTDALGRGYRLR